MTCSDVGMKGEILGELESETGGARSTIADVGEVGPVDGGGCTGEI
jgi:hypothetical protein